MATILIAYGIALAGLGIVLQQATPASAKVTFITGLAGGALCGLWGVVGLTGHKRRVWAVLTLVAVTSVVLSQVVPAWVALTGDGSGRLVGVLLLTLMMLLTVAMLMYLLHGERPPEFYMPGIAGRQIEPSRGKDARSEQQPTIRGQRK